MKNEELRITSTVSIENKNTSNLYISEVKGDVVKYINRRDSVYYLKKSLTKLGKVQHSAIMNISKTDPADLATEIPSGFEFYESPRDGQVFFRKIPVYNISDIEIAIVDAAMKTNEDVDSYILERRANEIVVFVTNKPDISYFPVYIRIDNIYKHCIYEDVMKFEKDKKTYIAQRFCYRSSFNDWIYLEESNDLKYLAEKYCDYIEKESFYELF